MNDRLPYEEQLAIQLADFPLPDVNAAWIDMRRRLDEDDDRVVPFWLRRGCAGWVLLLLLLSGLGWWILQPQKWWNKKEKTENVDPVDTLQTKNQGTSSNTIGFNDSTNAGKDKSNEPDSTAGAIETNEKKVSSDNDAVVDVQQAEKKKPANQNDVIAINQKAPRKTKPPQNENENEKEKEKEKGKETTKQYPNVIKGNKDSVVVPSDMIVSIDHAKKRTDSPKDSAIKVTSPPIDTLKKKPFTDFVVDSARKKTAAVDSSKTKKKEPKEKIFYFSAGLAMQQQIPIVDSQKFVSYNAQGRKGNLADYIPSVYLRFNKKNKWFFQAEFKYGAPQFTGDLLYAQRSDSNFQTQKLRTTTTNVIKTYYHQLPVTFNYFILPGWSIGAGVVWNKFHSAVLSRDISDRHFFFGIDTPVISDQILRIHKADSNFVNSYFQAAIESQYKIKRFSLGFRYTFGLQPYIKFTLPGGVMQEEKNKALYFFVRYELWKSKEKKKTKP